MGLEPGEITYVIHSLFVLGTLLLRFFNIVYIYTNMIYTF